MIMAGNLTNVPVEEITLGDRVFGVWEVVGIQKADNFGRPAIQLTLSNNRTRIIANEGENIPVSE